MKISQEELARMVNAFGKAWRDEDARNDRQLSIQRGSRRSAGLVSALKEIGIEVEPKA